MLVAGFPAGTFQANCYLLAPAPGGPGVIVDPGEDAIASLDGTVAEHGLTPVAILATHGHPDHVHAAAEAARTYDIPVWIRPEDHPLLRRPWRGLNHDLAAGLGARPWPEPHTVRELPDRTGDSHPVLELAGLRIEVLHTPGHTAGSVVFRLATGEGGQIALTGDTVMAGSAGRSDLPGGDPVALRRSLAMLSAVLDDDTVLLPGHGPSTTMGQEKSGNPWLTAPGDGGTAEAGGADDRAGVTPGAGRGPAEAGERRS
ncbi:MBL fold metallo-hydrolase [Prauserella halophila]|uniref:MBL fold metallo-hydrolase n=1 Tax=Prauserella halophila TaxID=185641 RepID=A0ABN1W1S0_9PSEU|nr:MBL fold metallo-hydrolase [Prauserella halophila]MCP2238721.1 Glyoxylase, beta-lactamase superfamily II [Prauserella halophila]